MRINKIILLSLFSILVIGYFIIDKSFTRILTAKRHYQEIAQELCSKPKNLEGMIVKAKNGLDVLVMGQEDLVSDCIYAHKEWEEHLQNLLQQVVKPDNKVLVLGGHIGYHVLLISKLVGPNGHISIFEPNPNTLKFLKANLAFNDITNSTLYPKAAYSKNTSLSFVAFTEGNTGNSHISKDPNQEAQSNKAKLITVDAVSIDTINEIKSIDVLQMDIEGSEIDAVYGATQLIDNSPNLIVLQEWWTANINGDLDKYLNFWRSRGYKIAQIKPKELKEMNNKELTSCKELIDLIMSKNLDDLIKNFKPLK
jgi:FkbM family methyltransferase